MRARRYTVLIADRSSGVVRSATISLRPAGLIVVGVFLLPILIGLGARWSARTEIKQVLTANTRLEEENSSYRAATGALTTQIQSLENGIDDLASPETPNPP